MIVFLCNFKGIGARLGSAHLEGVRQFSGKSIIITSAGKGTGRACAYHLAAAGAEIVAMSRTQSDLDSLHEEIGGCGLERSGQERAHDGAAPADRFAGEIAQAISLLLSEESRIISRIVLPICRRISCCLRTALRQY